MRWDPAQYARYADERGRPFVDLLAQVGATEPRRVVDLGCGPGTLTTLLAQRWPRAVVEGIDSSPEMIAKAAPLATARLSFAVADVASWSVPADADVVFSNALLQWVPTHVELLRRWADELPSGGWLAFQVPGNFGAPSHVTMRALAASPRWASSLSGVLRGEETVGSPASYASVLLDSGLSVQAWETTYLHVLPGPDPVVEWLRGTGLRPVLAALPPDDAEEFTAQLAARLREAYPPGPHGTMFPFRRLFVVASKP
ncbi:trans-aconitate 2-methyltransferase [uncultured Jatrophihabitans sp.]|uniref:trans-aconitate 2-methyltransferase n=1 Tax=uncultured Jatrophihabitans sp. TaxID=1610747 RepID=UPI0035CBF251